MQYKKPLFWDYKKTSFLSILLFPFSIIYLGLIWIIKITKTFKTYKKSPIPVLCVGNIYLGGTGKTPLAREIFNISKSLRKNPAFIKKYHSNLSDEINMLKNTGKTYTLNKRLEGIFLSFSENHDVAILDDGFQDFSIKPDLSILCFPLESGLGVGGQPPLHLPTSRR